MNDIKTFTADEIDVGQRLDKFLSLKLPEFSRSEITKFNVTKQISENTVPAKFSDKLKLGDTFNIEIPGLVVNETELASSNDFDLDIVYEDDDIILINKPRGVVMYPAAGNTTGTLVQNVLAHTHLSGMGGNTRPGVVHRLDKDTSGIVVFAKSDAAYRVLVKIFAEHDLTRKYVAFVWGISSWENATITGNIARSTRNRQKMAMVKKGGKPAETEIDVVDVWGAEKISEFRCTLKTGRTHQIRVHLSSHGYPVLCDPVYGRGTTRLGSVKDLNLLKFLKEHDGQMLHAEVLEFKHPVTGLEMKFKSKLPDDMQELKDILNSYKNL